MERLKNIISIGLTSVTQGNPAYDADKQNNGGGYDQPIYRFAIGFADGTAGELVFEDTSCGDFGTRYAVMMFVNHDTVYIASWGSMENRDCEYTDKIEWSEKEKNAILNSLWVWKVVYNHTGFWIPAALADYPEYCEHPNGYHTWEYSDYEDE